jgi:tetratricopeptide (TPR) repeat protein
MLATLLAVALAQPSTQELSIDELSHLAQEQNEVGTWIDLGNAYLDLDDFELAKNSFLEAIALDYLAGDGHFGLGLAEFGRGDYQAALFSFNEVTRLFPERFDGHYNRAVTLARLRRFDEAAQAFQMAISEADPEATHEDRITAYLGLAGQLKKGANFSAAADAYGSALGLEPDNADLAYLQAEALYMAERGLDALPSLVDLEGRSSDYRVSALIADIYVNEGQVDYALRSLDRALAKAEASEELEAQANILVKLGLLQRSLGSDAEAALLFQKAAALDSSSWEAHYNLGVSYLENGQPHSALSSLEQAILLNDMSGEIFLALATAFDQLSQAADAEMNARRSIEFLTDAELMFQAQFILGRSLYRMGDFSGALSEFEQVLRAEPGNGQVQLWLGLSEYQQGDYRAAMQYYERAVQLDPDSIEARVNLGASYLALERFQDAELVYQLLVQQNPQDAESFYNLGWALMSQSRRGAARDAWQQASDLGFEPAREALGQYF